jgi:hypothetical protein
VTKHFPILSSAEHTKRFRFEGWHERDFFILTHKSLARDIVVDDRICEGFCTNFTALPEQYPDDTPDEIFARLWEMYESFSEPSLTHAQAWNLVFPDKGEAK